MHESIIEMIEKEFRKKHGSVCPHTKRPYKIEIPHGLKNEVFCSECSTPYNLNRRKFLTRLN